MTIMALTPKDYQQMSQEASPPSNTLKNATMAFLFGGGFCALGQSLLELLLARGMERDEASALVSLSLILLSVLLTALGLYDRVARVAGAGTQVPIAGFANAMSSSAIEFRSEGLILGLGAKMFSIAGPVLVDGISAAALYGVIYYFIL